MRSKSAAGAARPQPYRAGKVGESMLVLGEGDRFDEQHCVARAVRLVAGERQREGRAVG